MTGQCTDGTERCSRCEQNEQLPTGTLCMGCVRDDLAKYDAESDRSEEVER